VYPIPLATGDYNFNYWIYHSKMTEADADEHAPNDQSAINIICKKNRGTHWMKQFACDANSMLISTNTSTAAIHLFPN
jgi:hypothetical protein